MAFRLWNSCGMAFGLCALLDSNGCRYRSAVKELRIVEIIFRCDELFLRHFAGKFGCLRQVYGKYRCFSSLVGIFGCFSSLVGKVSPCPSCPPTPLSCPYPLSLVALSLPCPLPPHLPLYCAIVSMLYLTRCSHNGLGAG